MCTYLPTNLAIPGPSNIIIMEPKKPNLNKSKTEKKPVLATKKVTKSSSELKLESQERPAHNEKARSKTLKQELKELELLYTLMLQWKFSAAKAEETQTKQIEKANIQFHDRGQQLVEIKKMLNAKTANRNAKNQTRVVDDLLNYEYSCLKPLEDDILLSGAYVSDLEKISYHALHRVDIKEDHYIDSNQLLESLGSSCESLQSIQNSVEEQESLIAELSTELSEFSEVLAQEKQELHKNKTLLGKFHELSSKNNIANAEKVLDQREYKLLEFLTEDIF